jgi:hypothetical protein
MSVENVNATIGEGFSLFLSEPRFVAQLSAAPSAKPRLSGY